MGSEHRLCHSRRSSERCRPRLWQQERREGGQWAGETTRLAGRGTRRLIRYQRRSHPRRPGFERRRLLSVQVYRLTRTCPGRLVNVYPRAARHLEFRCLPDRPLHPTRDPVDPWLVHRNRLLPRPGIAMGEVENGTKWGLPWGPPPRFLGADYARYGGAEPRSRHVEPECDSLKSGAWRLAPWASPRSPARVDRPRRGATAAAGSRDRDIWASSTPCAAIPPRSSRGRQSLPEHDVVVIGRRIPFTRDLETTRIDGGGKGRREHLPARCSWVAEQGLHMDHIARQVSTGLAVKNVHSTAHL